MIETAWKHIPKSERPNLVNRLNQLHHEDLFSLTQTRLKTGCLPWFPGWQLLKATDYAWHPFLTMYFFRQSPTIIKLDGTVQPFARLCARSVPWLNTANVYAYARFYMGSIQGAEGSFRLVNKDSPLSFNREATTSEIQTIRQTIKRPNIVKRHHGWLIETTLFYDDGIYDAQLMVTTRGIIKIRSEKLRVDNMPIREIMLK
ncbi:MAG: hypothetical protein GF313_16930 [Caldithrix sp.]|nr:hypothetical protein [Caldithrix sp.]